MVDAIPKSFGWRDLIKTASVSSFWPISWNRRELFTGARVQFSSPEVEEKHPLDTDNAGDMALLDKLRSGCRKPPTYHFNTVPWLYAGFKINAGKSRSMASARVLSRSRIVQTTPWKSTLKVAPSHRSEISPTWDNWWRSLVSDSEGLRCLNQQLSSIWNSRNIRKPTIKVRIYKAAILTILLYGSEA